MAKVGKTKKEKLKKTAKRIDKKLTSIEKQEILFRKQLEKAELLARKNIRIEKRKQEIVKRLKKPSSVIDEEPPHPIFGKKKKTRGRKKAFRFL